MAGSLAGARWLVLAMAFIVLAVADFGWLGLTRIIDQREGDIALALNARRRPVSDRIVFVDIDQKSLEDMNDLAGSWPWPRSIHGEMIDAIAAQHPRAIVFDVLFNEADIYRPEHDAAFADAVARNPNVWLAMSLNADGTGAWVSAMPKGAGATPARPGVGDARVPVMLPLVVAARPEAMRGGLINFTPDSDGVGRHHALWQERKGWRFPSMPAQVMRSLGRPLPPQQRILLNWRRDWRHVSFADVYLDALRERPQRAADEFRDRIVVIGTAAPGLLDLRVTPLASTYPGAQVLATALDNLDRGDWLREVPRSAILPLALALIGLVAAGFARQAAAGRLLVVMIGATVVVLAGGWLLLGRGMFVPVFAALAYAWAFYIAGVGLAYLEERTKRLRTSQMFKRFLDPNVVSDLIERGDFDHRNAAQAREISVLFSDIRGFTSLSEVSTPEDVVAMLNAYFSAQVGVIFTHAGTLDKFIGDAIMAFWGAPLDQPDHAARAVAAALDMSVALEAMRGQIGGLATDLEIGIGIHTGRAVVGFIGSSDRLDYTVIGDTVNLASRVEGLTKGIARVLVTQATRDAAGDAFDWRDVGFYSVKGREEQVRLYEPLRKV